MKLRLQSSYHILRTICKTSMLCLLLLMTLATVSVRAQKKQVARSFNSKFGPNAFVGYLAYVPKDYAANPAKKYPLLIFLHGIGEKAYMATDSSNLGGVKTHGPPKLIEAGMDFPFIVISPQCPFEDWENVTTDNYNSSVYRPGEFVDEILEKIKTLYRVDLNRIYLTGLSMGSAATWSYLMKHPEKIAASIPISGWIDNPADGCNIAKGNVPVWAFQNEADPKTIGTPGFIDYINACEPAPSTPAKITIYPGKEHDAWTVTYNNKGVGIAPDNIYDWLMRQSKGGAITGLPESGTEKAQKMELFPVPARNNLTINYNSEVSEQIHLQFFNETSGVVLSKNLPVQKGLNTIETDVTGIKNGYYLVSLTGSEHKLTKTLVVSR